MSKAAGTERSHAFHPDPSDAPAVDAPAVEGGPDAPDAVKPEPLRWLLVTGAARSGTTMLKMLLNRHEGVAILHEYGLPVLHDRLCRLLDHPIVADVRQEQKRKPAGDPDVPFTGYHEFFGAQRRRRMINTLAQSFYGELAGRSVHVVGDKMPVGRNDLQLDRMFALFPELLMLFIVRNPVDVVASSHARALRAARGEDDWPVRTVDEACLHWYAAWRAMLNLWEERPDDLIVVSYEAICADPAKALAPLHDRLALAPPAGMAPSAPVDSVHGRGVLSPEQVATVRTFLGAMVDADLRFDWRRAEAETALCGHAYPLGSLLDFSTAAIEPYLVDGFSGPEVSGRWTSGPRAILALRVEPCPSAIRIAITIGMTHNPRSTDPVFAVRINRGHASTYGETKLLVLTVAEADMRTDGVVDVEFLLPQHKRPDEAPLNDSRALGLYVETVLLTAVGFVNDGESHDARSPETWRT